MSNNPSRTVAAPGEGEEEDPEFVVSQDQLRQLLASGNPELIEAMQRGLARMIGQSSGYLEGLPAPVRTRIEFLEELQGEYEDLENDFKAELRELENKYKQLYKPIFEKRRAVVVGDTEAPENETEEGKKVAAEAGEEIPAGVPGFWLNALRNHPKLEEAITDKDAEVLEHLVDITAEDVVDEDGEDAGFSVTFHFKENPFFTDAALTMTYSLTEDQGYVQVTDIEGCDIHWRPDKDVTVKKMRKKPKPGAKNKAPATKLEPVESFFRWFSEVPEVPEGGAEEDGDDDDLELLRDQVEQHMQIGELIKEEIVPNAVKWFTGEALLEMEDEDEFDDEDDYEDEDDEEDDDDDDDDEDEDEGDAKGAEKMRGSGPKDSKDQPAECKQQ